MDTNKIAVPIAIIIAGGLIALSLYYSTGKLPEPKKAGTAPTAQVAQNEPTAGKMRPIDSTDHILGNPNAEVVIVEYSDTECPYCKMFHQTLKRVINEYGTTGKVAWVYRHFPIDQLHSKARKQAEATECVAELGGESKFWEYLNMIYDNTPSNNGLDMAQLPKFAKTVGVDVAKFNECLSSGRYTQKIQDHYTDAVAAGGRGTPNSIIVAKDGTQTVIQGAQSYEALKTTIDAILAK